MDGGQVTEPPLKICSICRGAGCDSCAGEGVGVPLDWLAAHGDEWEIVGPPGPERFCRRRLCVAVDVELEPPCGTTGIGSVKSGAVYCALHAYLAAISGELFFEFGVSEHERARRAREFRAAVERIAKDLAADDV